MAEKTPGKPRKSTSSRKKETSQKTSTVTPIDQAGISQSGSSQSLSSSSKQSGPAPNSSAHDGGRTSQTRPVGLELQERIRARAYELFEQRGRQEGFDQEDWAQAEAEVLAKFEREKSA